jgi:hypothetical protein
MAKRLGPSLPLLYIQSYTYDIARWLASSNTMEIIFQGMHSQQPWVPVSPGMFLPFLCPRATTHAHHPRLTGVRPPNVVMLVNLTMLWSVIGTPAFSCSRYSSVCTIYSFCRSMLLIIGDLTAIGGI